MHTFILIDAETTLTPTRKIGRWVLTVTHFHLDQTDVFACITTVRRRLWSNSEGSHDGVTTSTMKRLKSTSSNVSHLTTPNLEHEPTFWSQAHGCGSLDSSMKEDFIVAIRVLHRTQAQLVLTGGSVNSRRHMGDICTIAMKVLPPAAGSGASATRVPRSPFRRLAKRAHQSPRVLSSGIGLCTKVWRGVFLRTSPNPKLSPRSRVLQPQNWAVDVTHFSPRLVVSTNPCMQCCPSQAPPAPATRGQLGSS